MRKIIFITLLIISPFFLSTAYAEVNIKPPGGVGVSDAAKVPGTSAEKLVENIFTNVLNIFFTIGGLGVVIYFVWGAVDWILSGGDKEKVSSARKKMTHAIIGLVLLSLSFVIINIIGEVIGFNPLAGLQLRDLGTGK